VSRLARALGGAAAEVLRTSGLQRAALKTAAARGRAMVLLYHRVSPSGAAPHEVVPSLSTTLFRQQLEALGEVGDIVPLTSLLHEPGSRGRLRLAITFDDDDPRHVRHALPVLQALGVPATFFLSGASLHGLGPYWWNVLEEAIADRGLAETGRALGVAAASPAHLAELCEGSELAERLPALFPARRSTLLAPGEIRTLAAAGMTIGFHTLRHPVLTLLSDESLDRTLLDGRATLAAAAGAPVELLAYPHGRADRRVARRAQAAGYRAAFRTGRLPVHARSDPFLLGRWEPGPLPTDTLLARLALRLNCSIAERRR